MSTENKDTKGQEAGTATIEHQIHGAVVDCDDTTMEMGLPSPHQDAGTHSRSSVMRSSLDASAASNQVDLVHCIFTRTSTDRPQLLCPLTKQPLKDPVVNPTNGVSYERSAIICDEDIGLYPPNRALKDYLQAMQGLQEDSAVDSTNTDDSKKARTTKDLFAYFVCPITQVLLQEPVIDHEGNTYERGAIFDWVQEHGVSPITRNSLSIEQLCDNTTIFEVIIQERLLLQQHGIGNDELQDFKMAVSMCTPGDTGFAAAAYYSSIFLEDLPVRVQPNRQQPQELETTPPPNNANNNARLIQPPLVCVLAWVVATWLSIYLVAKLFFGVVLVDF
ncbi:U-box domain-containing protein [Seminavis robusta]|uniref:U-box domain-containing protein n=1 Tax=Seminavis robusta TaxID=568900 RepID=A0A9N8DHR8_9STRA|nr:U-box domain-containing protein [Seminavis robusta]|eukprot:Sro72_g039670.1 U-box domain-containing protein (333) ;mRNA; f:12367-13365